MIIKRYVADTMNEALNCIKLELGPEAIIVSKRFIRQKGIFSIFLPKKLEVTAALDENVKDEPVKVENVPGVANPPKKEEFEQELNEVKQMLQKLVEGKTVKEEKLAKRGKKTGIKKLLLQSDVHEDVVDKITDSIKKTEKYKGTQRIPDSAYLEEIDNTIKVNPAIKGRVHAFVGPTGVGKTTTIAKLAAIQSLNNKKRVGLITIDTYRIGAVEQLRIYADILALPFEVINSIGDIDRTMDKMKDCDIIFIDTTGRSIRNIMQLSELKLYLDKIKPDMTYLVVSMTTKYQDMLQILNGFSVADYDSVILTKFDETTTYGSILNVAYSTGAPIAYITAGQNVPDDIQEASREKLLDLVVGGGSI